MHWEAESSTAGWPCTLLRVTQVGGGHRPWDVRGRVRVCSGCDALLCPQGDSGKERRVHRLQFPSRELGPELPASALLPFLAAMGRSCSRGSGKPGTVLSHSRCGRREPWGRVRPLWKGVTSPSLHGAGSEQSLAPRPLPILP